MKTFSCICRNAIHFHNSVCACCGRLLYTLFRLRLPVVGRDRNPESGLCCDFLADPAAGEKIHTGHDNGLITINVDEADPSRREQMRQIMGERLPKFRALFGDERADYDDCLKRHNGGGAAIGWPATGATAHLRPIAPARAECSGGAQPPIAQINCAPTKTGSCRGCSE